MNIDETEPSVVLDQTFDFTISNYGFGDLSDDRCIEIYKDGIVFSHFIERWLEEMFELVHVNGCKQYDFHDKAHPHILYDEKTFTHNGCKYCPSNMLGQGRIFNKEVFEEKSKKMIFCIVSNVNFPHIRVKFVKGEVLMQKYPLGVIGIKHHDEFFGV
jgi:hypothetical protein